MPGVASPDGMHTDPAKFAVQIFIAIAAPPLVARVFKESSAVSKSVATAVMVGLMHVLADPEVERVRQIEG